MDELGTFTCAFKDAKHSDRMKGFWFVFVSSKIHSFDFDSMQALKYFMIILQLILRPMFGFFFASFGVSEFSLAFFQYGLQFYMQYLARWPEYFQVAESPSGDVMGYSKSSFYSSPSSSNVGLIRSKVAFLITQVKTMIN